MRTGIALVGVAVLAIGGVLAAGMLAAATATADPCPTRAPAAAAGPALGALALRGGPPALTSAARSPTAAPTGGVGGPVPPVVGTGPVCQPATAADLPQGPTSGIEAWVGVSAQQARVRNGAVIGQSPVSMVRRVLRADDGRWLVDVRVMAG